MKLLKGKHLLALAAVAAAATPACEGGGFYNMPSSLQQCLGFGYGPGYHAPMTLVVPGRSKTAAQGILWQWNAPQPPPCSHGHCAAAPPHAYYHSAEVYHPQPTPVYSSPTHATPARTPSAPSRPMAPPARPAASPGIDRSLTPLEPASPSDMNQPEEIPMPRN